jgi:hypothetical protein
VTKDKGQRTKDKGQRTKDKKYLELPQLPKEFKNKNLNDFLKGLLKSKYFIG